MVSVEDAAARHSKFVFATEIEASAALSKPSLLNKELII